MIATMSQIKNQVSVIKKTYKMSEAQISRLLDIPDKTFNAWMQDKVTCRHKKLLLLALERLQEKLK